MSDLILRLADLDNANDAAATLLVLKDYYESNMGMNKQMPDAIAERAIPGLQACANHRVYLAQHTIDDGSTIETLGSAVCFMNYSTFRAMPLLNIHDFVVRVPHQGRGIGKKLIRHVIDDARRIGCCAVTLEVRRDNIRARAIYSEFGFDGVSEPLNDETYLFGKLSFA